MFSHDVNSQKIKIPTDLLLKQIQNIGDRPPKKNLALCSPVDDIIVKNKTPKYSRPARPLYELNYLNNNSRMTKEL